ncbi:MAG: BatD family protein [Prevotella sp.]|nr:BatD family protein [Prevotella sp.]
MAVVVWALSIGQASAQRVESKISSMEMLVGEQVAITVTAHAQDTARVEFPRTLLVPAGIEVLEAIESEPVSEGNGMVNRRCDYVLTSFNDTLYPLPPIPVKISGKEYPTNQLALQVLTVDVDTTNFEKYYGPKEVQELPMSWTDDEWGKAFWLSFLVVALLLLAIWLWGRLKSNKPIIARIRIIKRVPPHQKAMKAIDEIKAERMVTAEDPKEYYTRLTDTLRQYINERYGFNAMEMTSSEIIDRLMKTDDPKSLDELRQLFTTADLVKFAKYSTLINENDANLVSAVDFINQTKQENVPTEEVVKPELTTEQVQTRKMRKVLIVALAVIGIAALALIVYIGWFMYDLLLY